MNKHSGIRARSHRLLVLALWLTSGVSSGPYTSCLLEDFLACGSVERGEDSWPLKFSYTLSFGLLWSFLNVEPHGPNSSFFPCMAGSGEVCVGV